MNDPDILARLRESDGGFFMRKMFAEAADEIERLREQLRLANIDSFNTIADAEQLRAERDEARRRTNFILTEIDCRIEHGAESSGHLEVLRDMFKEKTDE